mmetsp:Transcript_12692/g.38905  ORF Transcript_12692/g.38905 Transcript_12692/m.38905 type:complete len:871 (-) Transcript_12692:229-2841(-)
MMFEVQPDIPARDGDHMGPRRSGSVIMEGSPAVQIDEEDEGPVEMIRSTNMSAAYHAPEYDEDESDDEDEPEIERRGPMYDEEEDEELSLDHEALFSVGKMTELLEHGSDHEKSIILFEIQQLLDHCLEDTLKILVPVLCLHVHTWAPELQLAAAEALIDVVHHEIPADVAKMISAASFRVVNRAVVDTIYESWGEILVAVLPNVSWNEQELERVIALIDVHARRNNEISRKLAARVLGALCVCLTPEKVEKHILQRALDLCEDEDIEVRGMVTESLQFIGAALSIDVTETKIWPKILQLLEDPDARIHAATLRSIAHLLETHRESEGDKPLYTEQLPPVFLKHCEFSRKAAAEDQRIVDDNSYLLLEIFSEVFGPFLASAYKHITDENQKKDVYKAFLAIATCNGPVVRRHCAFNMPGVAKSFGNKFQVELSNIVEFLSRDTDAETRWNLGAGIHITTSILVAKSTVDNLFKSIVGLLRDENPLVRMNTLQHFSDLLYALMMDGEYSSASKLSPVFRNLRLLSEGNWRTQELLAQQLDQAATFIPHEALKANVLPLLFQMAEESTYLVRKAATGAIVKSLRYIPQVDERQQLVENFCVEWAQGGVFWMRNAFLEGAETAFRVYSRSLFKQFFAAQILRLCGDPVPNVRLRLAQLLCVVGIALEDEPQFAGVVQMLKLDEDEDVQDAISRLSEDLEKARSREDEYQMEDQKRLAQEGEILQKYHSEKSTKKIPGIKKMLVKTFGGKNDNSAVHSPMANSSPRSDHADYKLFRKSRSHSDSDHDGIIQDQARQSLSSSQHESQPVALDFNHVSNSAAASAHTDNKSNSWGGQGGRSESGNTSGRRVIKQLGNFLKTRRKKEVRDVSTDHSL